MFPDNMEDNILNLMETQKMVLRAKIEVYISPIQERFEFS